MPVHPYARRYAQRPILARASRAIPWLGATLAAAAIVSAMRRKGVLHGALDTALTVMPVIGALKLTMETVRGRDFFPDREHRRVRAPLHRPPAVSHG